MGTDRERLLHNLIAIQAANETALSAGNPREIITYATGPNDPFSFDRVLTYTVGGTNHTEVPAGGKVKVKK